MSATILLMSLAAAAAVAPAPSASASSAKDPIVRWSAPASFVEGLPYQVELEIEAPEGGAAVPAWVLTPAAFTADGKVLAERGGTGSMDLPAGFKVSGRLDLSTALGSRKDFELACVIEGAEAKPVKVSVMKGAPQGLDFMKLPVDQLAQYAVLLHTNRGDILVKTWPDVAPEHARNFLDLAYTGFYDGSKFHRAIENFMIQGGDPTGTGTGSGPRQLKLEPSAKKHVRGVLSMARAQDPNSASCQFFIMHGANAGLDGQYSAFGEVLSGMDTVDRIATTPKTRQGSEMSAPVQPQVVERALVVLAPAEAAKK
jgi:cyclophilin family peptidyl-prolyl cis-trans isomerase